MTIFSPEFRAFNTETKEYLPIPEPGPKTIFENIQVGDKVYIESKRPFVSGGPAIITEVNPFIITCGKSHYNRFMGDSLPSGNYYISHVVSS